MRQSNIKALEAAKIAESRFLDQMAVLIDEEPRKGIEPIGEVYLKGKTLGKWTPKELSDYMMEHPDAEIELSFGHAPWSFIRFNGKPEDEFVEDFGEFIAWWTTKIVLNVVFRIGEETKKTKLVVDCPMQDPIWGSRFQKSPQPILLWRTGFRPEDERELIFDVDQDSEDVWEVLISDNSGDVLWSEDLSGSPEYITSLKGITIECWFDGDNDWEYECTGNLIDGQSLTKLTD